MALFKWGSLDLGKRWRAAQDAQQQREREANREKDALAIRLLAKNAPPKELSAADRLDAALRAGDLAGVKAELDAGVSPDVQLRGPIPDDGTMVGVPEALDGASGWFLIPNVGGIPRARSRVSYTPLMWAMATANLTLADLLVAAGAKLLAPNDERRTPLSVAAKAGSPKALIWIAPQVTHRDWTKEDGDLSPRAWVERHDPVLAEALDGVVKPTIKPATAKRMGGPAATSHTSDSTDSPASLNATSSATTAATVEGAPSEASAVTNAASIETTQDAATVAPLASPAPSSTS